MRKVSVQAVTKLFTIGVQTNGLYPYPAVALRGADHNPVFYTRRSRVVTHTPKLNFSSVILRLIPTIHSTNKSNNIINTLLLKES